ncbi:MAG: hypothetical protein JWS12_67 [Candidatus Saccharibacteria bacterium]|nr:hypothetical protein [Candidatus Saccharibacteria bacterium]
MDGSVTLKLDDYLTALGELLKAATGEKKFFRAIVNAPFENKLASANLSLGIVVFLLVNKHDQTIDRIALSDTEPAQNAVTISEKRFEEIKIPLQHKSNSITEAIASGKPQITADWKYLFIPEMSPQAARFNQANAGIGYSVVYPLQARNGGALIFSYYQEPTKITAKHWEFMKNYSQLVSSLL